MRKRLTLLVVASVFCGCSDDSPDDLLADPTPISAVTYTNSIASIISANCLSCHSNPTQNGAPMSLTTYDLVKQAIQTRPLVDRISRPQGADGMMPLGGVRLPQSQIDLIVLWQQQGLQE